MEARQTSSRGQKTTRPQDREQIRAEDSPLERELNQSYFFPKGLARALKSRKPNSPKRFATFLAFSTASGFPDSTTARSPSKAWSRHEYIRQIFFVCWTRASRQSTTCAGKSLPKRASRSTTWKSESTSPHIWTVASSCGNAQCGSSFPETNHQLNWASSLVSTESLDPLRADSRHCQRSIRRFVISAGRSPG